MPRSLLVLVLPLLVACGAVADPASGEVLACGGDGQAACDDCVFIESHTTEQSETLAEADCLACQGEPCVDGLAPTGCQGFICDADAVLVVACLSDDDCPSGVCGQYTGQNGVCVTDDDI